MIPALACLALAFGCGPKGDAGQPCTLLKSNGAPMTERDLGSNRDLISFGAASCDDLICVRDAAAPSTGDLDAPLTGICSRSCVPSSPCESATPARLSCRALLLDEATLVKVCEDPQLCQRVGNSRSPFFCAAAR